MGKLDGLVTLVTGAGSGIGEAIATVFAEEGATVVVNDVSHDAAHAAVASLPPVEGGDHVSMVADVSSSEQVRSMFAHVGERFGRLDVLVNNAGIVEGAPGERERLNEQVGALRRDARSGKPRTVHWDLTPHISDESWDRMIGVHLSGTFYCCREAIPLLVAAGSGSIVNMSSIGAIRGGAGFPHYSAAKAGILGFTRSLAGELGSREIRVNAILPGNVDTPMTQYYSDEWWASVMAGQPIARMGRPREIAMTALFLASDDASFYTGQALSPNGGIVMFS